jgi:hypothetical protein
MAIAPQGHSAAQMPQPLQLSQPKQLPQDMHRRASNSAVDSSRPPVTSSNVPVRRAAASLGRTVAGASA